MWTKINLRIHAVWVLHGAMDGVCIGGGLFTPRNTEPGFYIMNRSEIYAAYVAVANAAGIRVLSNTSFQSKSEIIDATSAASASMPGVVVDVTDCDDAPDVTDIIHDGSMNVAPAFASIRLLSAPTSAVVIMPTFDAFDIGDTLGDIAAFVDGTSLANDMPRSNSLAARSLSGVCGYIHDKMDPQTRGRARRWWRRIHGVVDHTLFGRWAVSRVPVELCNELGFVCHPTPRGQ